MCAEKWSPWLHMLRSDKYTVVDCVNVRFDEALPLATVEIIRKELGCNSDDRIVYDRNRYRPWEGAECKLQFSFEPLDLHIVDTWAYFEDSLGRQSRLTFLIDDDAEDCGPVYMTATSGAENIPWLLCVS